MRTLMKTKIIIHFLFVFCLFHYATSDKYIVGSGRVIQEEKKVVTEKVEKNDTLIIIARIIEIPGTFPPNDAYNYVYVMKYRVIKVEKGNLTEKEILVGHYNPKIPRDRVKDDMDLYVNGDVKKFEVGAKHRLVLIDPMTAVWNDAVETDYFDSEIDPFYALKVDNAK